MNKKEVIGLASMPLQSPTYPRGPYKFFNRQYLVIRYKTDAAAIREQLPEPLEPDGDIVSVQWLDLPDELPLELLFEAESIAQAAEGITATVNAMLGSGSAFRQFR